MKITVYEFAALFSLLAVGYAAGWCFKGLWDRETDGRKADKYFSSDEWEE